MCYSQARRSGRNVPKKEDIAELVRVVGFEGDISIPEILKEIDRMEDQGRPIEQETSWNETAVEPPVMEEESDFEEHIVPPEGSMEPDPPRAVSNPEFDLAGGDSMIAGHYPELDEVEIPEHMKPGYDIYEEELKKP